MGARDYIVTAAERQATGKTTAQIIQEREQKRRAQRRAQERDKDDEPIRATPRAQEILSGLAETTPKFGEYAQDKTPPKFETVESRRPTRTVLVTGRAAEVYENLTPEQQARMVQPDTDYRVISQGSRISETSRYYRQPEKRTYIPEQLSRAPVLTALQNRQLREQGFTKDRTGQWVDDTGRPIQIDQAAYNQALRINELGLARQRGALREYESGKISINQLNAVQRDILLQQDKFNRQQARIEKDRQIEENKALRRQGDAVSNFYQQEEAYLNKPLSTSDKQFNKAYDLTKEWKQIEQSHAQKSQNVMNLMNIGTQAANPLEMGYNWFTKGAPIVDYESRSESVFSGGIVGKGLTHFWTRTAEMPQNLLFLGEKAVYETRIAYHSRRANLMGSLKSELKDMPKPFTSEEPRYKAFRNAFNPLKPEGLATWGSIALSTFVLGSQIKAIRTAPAKAPAGFKQEATVIFTKTRVSDKYQPIGQQGLLKPVPATKILSSFKSGKHIQINMGLDVKQPVGIVKYGSKGNYWRSDFLDLQTGKSQSMVIKSGLFGSEKRSVITQTPIKGDLVNIGIQTTRTRAITGAQFQYKPQTYQTTLPTIYTDSYISNRYSTGDYKIFQDKIGSNKMFEYRIDARNVDARYFYNKNILSKQYIDVKQNMNIYRDIFSKTTQKTTANTQSTLFRINQPNKELLMFTKEIPKDFKGQYPRMEIGRLNFPSDKTYLTGSEKGFYVSSSSYARADSISFLRITDPRLIKNVFTGVEQKGTITYTTASRLPDYAKSIQSNPYVARFLADQSGKVSLVPQLRTVQAPRQSIFSVATQKQSIVPNFPIQSMLPLSAVLQTQRITPLVIPVMTTAPPLQKRKVTIPQQNLELQKMGLLSLPDIQNVNLGQRTSPMQQQKLLTQPLQIQGLFTQTAPVLQQRTALTQSSIISPSIPIFPITPTPIFPPGGTGIPPPPLIVPPFFPGSGKEGKGSGKRRGSRYQQEYTPSLIGFDFKIKAPKGFNPKTFLGSGLGIRPLI